MRETLGILVIEEKSLYVMKSASRKRVDVEGYSMRAQEQSKGLK